MQTKPLYLENSYQKTCNARVLEITPTQIVLDQTIFYPEGGGQPSDQGIIKTNNVQFRVDHVLLKDEKIIHEGKIKGEINIDDEVTCEIDWDRRYKNMQVHSARHILHEAIKLILPDTNPVSAQHGKKAFIKYEGLIEPIIANRIKDKTNELLNQELAIHTEFVTLDELKSRSSWIPTHLPKDKPLRIMWIGDFQPIPDGGTQVKNTSEIPTISEVLIEHENNCSLIIYKLSETQKNTISTISYLPNTASRNLLNNLKNEALAMITNSSSNDELEQLKIQFLGKSGKLNDFLKNLSIDEKKEIGQLFNEIKQTISSSIVDKFQISNFKFQIQQDLSIPGIKLALGHLHPVTYAIEEITKVFEKIGFVRQRYPEVEWDWYAFGALNFPDNHPARDDWETFFIDTESDKHLGRLLLTPHTSNGQVREMERVKVPPIRMINIAKCYRRQVDISHTPMFHQFEGLVIDKNITVANLKGTTDYFVQNFFGPTRKSRLRPYHFQFTEPSFEVDISCDLCEGRGCRMCKEGWLELGGAGMVHPNVLRAGNIDPEVYTGFAFGWGVERTYMMKAGTKIDDIRLLYGNDLRFLSQF